MWRRQWGAGFARQLLDRTIPSGLRPGKLGLKSSTVLPFSANGHPRFRRSTRLARRCRDPEGARPLARISAQTGPARGTRSHPGLDHHIGGELADVPQASRLALVSSAEFGRLNVCIF